MEPGLKFPDQPMRDGPCDLRWERAQSARASCQMLWALQKDWRLQAQGTASSHSHTMGLRQGKPLIYHSTKA